MYSPVVFARIYCFWRNIIYAVIESGGKQYIAGQGDTIDVERLGSADGESVELDRVLLIADGNKITVGSPFIEGARVVATSKGEVKDDKIIVFKYKPKVRYRKKTGHRQIHTRLIIDSILPPGAKKPRATKKTKKAKAEVTENGA